MLLRAGGRGGGVLNLFLIKRKVCELTANLHHYYPLFSSFFFFF